MCSSLGMLVMQSLNKQKPKTMKTLRNGKEQGVMDVTIFPTLYY